MWFRLSVSAVSSIVSV